MSLAYIRSLLITDPIIIIATIIMGSISLIVSLFDPAGRKQHEISRMWSRMLLKVSGVKMRIEGLEKIEPARSYVFVVNHRSLMDTPVVLAHIPVQFRFLAKKGLFSIPLLGTHLRRARHLPVVRDNPRASLKSMGDAARIIRERGISVLLFPEGGRGVDQCSCRPCGLACSSRSTAGRGQGLRAARRAGQTGVGRTAQWRTSQAAVMPTTGTSSVNGTTSELG